MTVQTKIHDGVHLHLNALTMEVKEILTLIYDTPRFQQVANTYTPQFWAKIQYGSQNPIKFAKISKHRLILVHNKLGNPGSYCAKNHVIPPKPLRSNAKKTSKG